MKKKYLLMACISEQDTREPQKWVSPQANFDLIYLTYSKSLIFQKYLTTLNVPVYQVNSGKWKNIKNILERFGFGKYQYYFFPDPDLEIDVDSINKLFKIANENKFALCQPALTHNSFGSHEELYSKAIKNEAFRTVSMVEIMCPCFSKALLKKLLWTFELSFSGYGLDFLWAKYVQGYVIDSITVRHPRPQNFHFRAKLAGFPNPDDELKLIKQQYL